MHIGKDQDMRELNPAANLGSSSKNSFPGRNPGKSSASQTNPNETKTIASDQPMITTTSPEVSKNTSDNFNNSDGEIKYAGATRRYGAVVIDCLLVGTLTWIVAMTVILPLFFVGLVDDLDSVNLSVLIIVWLMQIAVWIGYYVYFIGSKGQTPGKMLFRIKVQSDKSGNIPGYTPAFLREIVGKIVSGLVFGLGYLWILWDNKKQGWHDKIAGTVAVEDGELSTLRKFLLGFIIILPVLAMLGIIAVFVLVLSLGSSWFEMIDQQQILPEEFRQEFEQLKGEMMQDLDSKVSMPEMDFDEN